LFGGKGVGSGEREEVAFAAEAAAGREGVAVFFEGLAGDGGAAGVFADGGEEVIELDRGDVAEAGLEAEILSGGGHGDVALLGISRRAVVRYSVSRMGAEGN
jgi:hypothetical protein